ncbi:MAG TPA: threonylcarbamoyl-AMP synthase [Thermodesulfobacteriaceae bacterium]|nr:threonylcarbamoyl-AMP synthase [Thermodesulfobacteriaceae bacterium]
MLLEIDPERPRPRQIQKVVEALKRGKVIVYPTDTCYGIGADIFNKKAIGKIYRIKDRPKQTPFSFVCAGLRDISRYAHISNYAYRILRRFLPGPYTFILEGSRQVPKMMLTRRRTAGIRIPDHPVCEAIAAALGNPIISTSVRVGKEPVISDPREMAEVLGRRISVTVDCGIIPAEPSSVVSLVNNEPVILRRGKGDVTFFEL